MKVGTKSLLFGVHLWWWHPFVVALAWWKLYGFPWDPRLWVAFLVHDWGYWGCPEMDGPKGELHPYAGAKIMHWLFDYHHKDLWSWNPLRFLRYLSGNYDGARWYFFCLNHSRFLAKRNGDEPSRLCMADKLAVALEPWWLYLPRAWASGELKEYMRSSAPDGKHGHMNLNQVTAKGWYQSVQRYLLDYAQEHKDGKKDNVTQISPMERYTGKIGV